ncbi:MAG: UvrD-helicase domain-containing protein, partial [Planctomycetota bacterium]
MSPNNALAPLLIKASAGTGKTYQLTGRLLAILVAGAAPDSVLASTFTRKAAGEILQRLFAALASGAADDSGNAAQALSQQAQRPISQIQCVGLLHELVSNVHRLRIGTLDGLFSQIAGSFSSEIGLPTPWRLCDEVEDATLSTIAVDQMMRSMETAQLRSLLSMLSKDDRPRSVAREMQSVVQDTYSASRFADPAAWNKLRVPGAPDDALLANALHVIRNTKLDHRSADPQIQKVADLLESRDLEALSDHKLVLGAAEGTAFVYYRKNIDGEFLQALHVVYNAARSFLLARLAAQSKSTGQLLAIYDARSAMLRADRGVVSFEDVAVNLAKWVNSNPMDPALLAHRMDGAIDHVLLDEFQDTSPAQWSVLYPLAKRCADGGDSAMASVAGEQPLQRSFFCVGDTKQAIYGWRGGVAEIFDSVHQEIPNVETRGQNTSYRSSPMIMDAVNTTFQNLTRHPSLGSADPEKDNDTHLQKVAAIAAFQKHFPTHETARSEMPGSVHLHLGPHENDAQQRKPALQ